MSTAYPVSGKFPPQLTPVPPPTPKSSMSPHWNLPLCFQTSSQLPNPTKIFKVSLASSNYHSIFSFLSEPSFLNVSHTTFVFLTICLAHDSLKFTVLLKQLSITAVPKFWEGFKNSLEIWWKLQTI